MLFSHQITVKKNSFMNIKRNKLRHPLIVTVKQAFNVICQLVHSVSLFHWTIQHTSPPSVYWLFKFLIKFYTKALVLVLFFWIISLQHIYYSCETDVSQPNKFTLGAVPQKRLTRWHVQCIHYLINIHELLRLCWWLEIPKTALPHHHTTTIHSRKLANMDNWENCNLYLPTVYCTCREEADILYKVTIIQLAK